MCGRFALQSTADELADYFNAHPPQQFVSRFNIAPTTPVIARTAKELTFFQWGLVPSWAKDLSIGHRMFNAHSETIGEKPSFRNAFKRRRCLVPASGFYEWKAEAGGKQPYYCHLTDPLFCFAGIWEHWQDAMGNELQSCAILTTESKGPMADIYQRMPVVIKPEFQHQWLDHQDENTQRASECIEDGESAFEIYPVSKMVNAARNDSAQLIEPLS